ncbi:MAG: LytTR family DNA-binding domain-containing protein [Planctomycetota bacterium]
MSRRPIRVVLVDDEPLARDALRLLASRHDDIEIVGECGDCDTAVAVLLAKRPDLVFLDIRLPGGTGFDVLERLDREAWPLVIFATAFDEHAIRAFEARALDYLVKPFNDDRFEEAVRRAKAQIRQRDDAEVARRMAGLLADRGALFESGDGGANRLELRAEGKRVLLEPREIDWVEASGYTACFHVNGTIYRVRRSLDAIETDLERHRFLRVHRSAIVNLDRARVLHPGKSGDATLELQDGTRIPVSRARRAALEAVL